MYRSIAFAITITVLPVGWIHPAAAQAEDHAEAATEWNSPRALELIDRGRAARTELALGDLETYRSLAEGHVYFFLDPERGERSLIRIDQVAVDVTWRTPGRVRQHIVGERSDTRLPVREFDYYLDRVTLVPHGFGNQIRIGSGMDVAGVPHPLGADRSAYDVRLADSLAVSLPARSDPLRLYELEVRPRNPDRPGMIGTMTLDGASAQIVRMAFTFTPASYVDPRTDWISVELDYGLWEERYWLPHEQRIEVRREVPEVDLGVGTVIRSVVRVGDYALNVALAEPPLGASVTRAPPEDRRNYSFREGLYDGMERDGLADLRTDGDLRRLRTEALERLDTVPPSALSPLRLHLPGPSSLLRYSRVEGVVPSVGGSLRPTSGVRVRGLVGYAFGAGHVRGEATMDAALSRSWSLETDLRHNTTGDLGLIPAIDPVLSSLGAVLRGEDYRDPFHRTGAAVRIHRHGRTIEGLSLGLAVHRIQNARLVSDSAPVGERPARPVRPVTDGTFTEIDLGLRVPVALPANGRGKVSATVGGVFGGPGDGIALEGRGSARWGPPSRAREAGLSLRGWSWWGDPLPRGHRLVGGRASLPGFPFRTFGGRSALAATAEVSSDVRGPLVRVRAGLHAGWTDRLAPPVAEAWNVGTTQGTRVSASVGIGAPWDLVRLDLARGLNGGEWQLLLGLDPAWWDRL